MLDHSPHDDQELFASGEDLVGKQATVEEVEDFARALSRLALGKRLYAPVNRLIQIMTRRLSDTWEVARKAGEPIELRVLDEQVLYRGVPIFEADDPSGIGPRLHKDGVRGLVFSVESTLDELVSLLDIFNDLDPRWERDSSCLDRLWILDLQHVHHDSADRIDDLPLKSSAKVLWAYAQATEKMVSLDFLEDPERANDPNHAAQRISAALDDGAVDRVLAELEMGALMAPDPDWSEDEDPVDAGLSRWFGALVLAQSFMDGDDVRVAAQRAFSLAFSHGGPKACARIVEVCYDEGRLGAATREAAKTTNHKDALEAMMSAARPSRRAAVGKLILRIFRVAPMTILDLALDEDDPERQRVLLDLLEQTEADVTRAWFERSARLDDTLMLEVLERTPMARFDADAEIFAARAFSSKSAKVRGLAAARVTGPLAARLREQLTALANDADLEVRCAAVRALARSGDDTACIYVFNKLKRGQMTHERELGVALDAILPLYPARFSPFLREALGLGLKPKAGLFRRNTRVEHDNPLGDEVVLKALMRHENVPELRQLLQEVADDPHMTHLARLLQDLREIENARKNASTAWDDAVLEGEVPGSRASSASSASAVSEVGLSAESSVARHLAATSSVTYTTLAEQSSETLDARALLDQMPTSRREVTPEQLAQVQQGRQLLHEFFSVLRTSAYHAANNAALDQPIAALARSLAAFGQRARAVRMEVAEGQFFINNQRVQPSARQHHSIAVLELFFEMRNLGGVAIATSIDEDTLRQLAQALIASRIDDPEENGPAKLAAVAEQFNVHAVIRGIEPAAVNSVSELDRSLEALNEFEQAVMTVAKGIALQRAAEADLLDPVEVRTQNVRALASMDPAHHYIALGVCMAQGAQDEHVRAMSIALTAILMAQAMGWDRSRRLEFTACALALAPPTAPPEPLLALGALVAREPSPGALRHTLGVATHKLPPREAFPEGASADEFGELLGVAADWIDLCGRTDARPDGAPPAPIPAQSALEWMTTHIGQRYATQALDALVRGVGIVSPGTQVETNSGHRAMVLGPGEQAGTLLARSLDTQEVAQLNLRPRGVHVTWTHQGGLSMSALGIDRRRLVYISKLLKARAKERLALSKAQS